jgi:uracil phosphoribosyltransferase
MTTHNLSDQPSLVHHFLAELRDADIQIDRARFRRNMTRLGEITALEISKTLPYQPIPVETPLGTATQLRLRQRIVLGTILRAGLPFHEGMLRYFNEADNAFISAYRSHLPDGSFEIKLDYISAPRLDDSVLILCDPMLATGASILVALRELERFGQPASIHVASIIASTVGVEAVRSRHPKVHIWAAAVDDELTAKGYIVPGLGDAGDLSYGEKR